MIMQNVTENDLVHFLIDKNKITIPNFYFKNFECDVFCVTKNNYSVEYEIKNSVSDFRKDAKKVCAFSPCTKHDLILSGSRTNRFFFVLPLFVFEAVYSEIPKSFGVITFNNHYFSFVRQSKRFHNRQIEINFFETLAHNLSWRLYYNSRK